MKNNLFFAGSIFLSAFLLFQIQPIIGKYILPWYGGSMSVWTTCMLFFQLFLLFGYAYAHLLTRYIPPRIQVLVHALLLFGSLALLPVIPSAAWKPQPDEIPSLSILWLLAANLGLPYFVLSATSPLLQRWFALLHPQTQPYRLFALSNAGSLLGLATYPFLIEPLLTRTEQATVWSVGIIIFTLSCIAIGFKIWNLKPKAILAQDQLKSKETDQPITTKTRILWLALPASTSLLLLAMTNELCREIVVIPFLWIMPLVVYLLTFILSFDRPRWYSRTVFGIAFGGSAIAACAALLFEEKSLPILFTIFPTLLFSACMIGHGELARLKPSPGYLTSYYLMIALGGVIGSFMVAFLAPLLFDDYFEFDAGILLSCFIFFIILFTDKRSPLYHGKRKWAWAGIILITTATGWGFFRFHANARIHVVTQERDFYGVLSIADYPTANPNYQCRMMSHDGILHGQQFLDPALQKPPVTYYSPKSGLGVALLALQDHPMRVGAVGLGVGTVAAWARKPDYYRFYELNPSVVKFAENDFYYLKNCKVKPDIILGDARLSMERERPQEFDVLVLDAFNSDSPPIHLLTKEAFEIYLKHVKPDGVIMLHATSSFLDFYPVIAPLATELGLGCRFMLDQNEEKAMNRSASVWIMLTKNEYLINHEEVIKISIRRVPGDGFTYWTDDASSLFPILNW